MNFNFGEILTRAWQIIWKHKVLWIFGILASCGRGGGGSGGGNSGGDSGFGTGTDLPPQLERFVEWVAGNVVSFVVIVVTLACILGLLSIFIGAIGRIGLIRGTAQADGGAESMIFGQLFSESTPYFWRVFGLSLLAGLPFFIVIIVAVLLGAVFAVGISQGSDASVLGLFGMVPIFIGCLCLLIPFILVINLIVHQSERVIVLEDAPVMPSLSRGWELFRNNLGPIILMAIILGVIGLAAEFIVAIPLLVAVVPLLVAYSINGAQSYTPLVLMAVCVCLYIPFALALRGIVVSYTESAWTLTFLRLTHKPDSNDILTPPSETPPSMDDPDKTMISASNA